MIQFPVDKNDSKDIELIRKKITQASSPQKPATKIFKLRVTPDDAKKINSSAKPGKKMKSLFLSPLEKTELKHFKLMGVMLSDSGNIAIVKDLSGKEYIISRGTRIGKNSGQVIRILVQKIIVEEQHRDKKGDIIKVRKELNLPGERKP
jgi:Tfp pilus assembly protein PilP